jgi:branched-chain amino acid transport system ATP-binding protein
LPTDALTLDGVDAFYGDAQALEGVSFAVKEGSLLGLLGRNGAGKSTTLGTIVGLLTPRRGRIDLFGNRISGLRPERIATRGVALVPQGRRVFRNLTVAENLTVAARGPSGGGSRRWTLESVYQAYPRLEERRNHLAAVLSGGEQQMLAIARALMTNPRLLLMDEPSEGLAPQIVADVVRLIQSLRGEGLSILLVEQSPKLLLEIADTAVILSSGRVVMAEPTSELRAKSVDLAQHLGVF